MVGHCFQDPHVIELVRRQWRSPSPALTVTDRHGNTVHLVREPARIYEYSVPKLRRFALYSNVLSKWSTYWMAPTRRNAAYLNHIAAKIIPLGIGDRHERAGTISSGDVPRRSVAVA